MSYGSLSSIFSLFCFFTISLSTYAKPKGDREAWRPNGDVEVWRKLKFKSPDPNDGEVTFRHFAPQASHVELGGSVCGWKLRPMTKGIDGIWSVRMDTPEKDPQFYGFSIDGSPLTPDPMNRRIHTGAGDGTALSIITTSESEPRLCDQKKVPHGEVQMHWLKSNMLGQTRRISIYLPPSRNKPNAVLYLLHGKGCTESSWVDTGKVNLILDNLLAAGTVAPTIVIMPDTRGNGEPGEVDDIFKKHFEEEILPFVQSIPRLLSGKEEAFLAGDAGLAGKMGMAVGDTLSWLRNAKKFMPDVKPWDGPELMAPQYGKNGKVTFSYYSPDAISVKVGGSMSQWRFLPMRKDISGTWKRTIGPIAPDTYIYGFSVGGACAVSNPAHRGIRTRNGMSTALSYLELAKPGQPMFHEIQDVPHGTVRMHWIDSSILGEGRCLYTYTPPGYEQKSYKDYPVLYLLHGGLQNERAWIWTGRVNFIMDNMIAEGKTEPAVLVMPFSHGITPLRGTNRTANFEEFAEHMLKEIMPFVEKNYRVRTDKQNTGVAGFSTGAARSRMIGLRNLDRFGCVASFSGGGRLDAECKKTFDLLKTDVDIINRDLDLYWLSGNVPGEGKKMSDYQTFLIEKGIKFTSRPDRFGHSMQTCRHIMYYDFLPLVFQ